MIWLNFARESLPWPVASGPRINASEPSPIPIPCSLGVLRSELARDRPASCSLGLLVLVGFVLGEFAGDAVMGGGRGC